MATAPRSHVTLRPEAVTFDSSARPPVERTYALDFKTESVLGEGGMGRVFAARDQRLGRKVAIKELRAEVRDRGELWGRFVREAQIGGQLEHPNIVPIYGFELSPDGGPAFVMQLVEGESLGAYLDRARSEDAAGNTTPLLALKERLAKILPVADAIAYAHGRGVLHRDLKPDNIMLGAHNVVLVTDWGIARVESDEAGAVDRLSVEAQADLADFNRDVGTSQTLVGDSGPAATAATMIAGESEGEGEGPSTRVISRPVKTALGAVLGTAPYMSPEQARGLTVGPGSDQYALGLILLELATLRTARNHEDTQMAFNQAIRGEQCAHVDLRERPLDPRLSAIIERATAEEPARRYPSVEAFARDVRSFLVDEEVSVAPDSRARKLVRSLQRHPGRSVGALSLVLLALASLALASLWKAASRAEVARADSQALSRLTSLVLSDGQGLDHYLLGLDSELVGLAEITRVRLEQAAMGKGEHTPTFFTPRDFAFGTVPGLVTNHIDGRLRSYREPVFVFLPGSGREAHEAASKLALGKADLIALYLENIDPAAHKLDASSQEALMAGDHDGLVRLMVLLDSGLFVQFPGFGDFPAGYDPRAAGWYARATLDRGSAFTRPKYGPRGQTPRVSLVRAVRMDNRVVGAAASGVWLKTLVGHLGKRAGAGLREVFVAGKDGKEVISRKVVALALSNPGESEAPVDLPDVSSAKLRRALGSEHAQGFVIHDKALFVYSRLAAEDWILVHRYDREQHLSLLH
jgi:serine/threonine protein kinase